jgi:flagellar biosynthesis/type III secretory pathway protein FliH
MALIKGVNSTEAARSAIVLDLGDLTRQGAAILDAAKRQAAQIVRDAQAERARLISDAAAVGRAEGLAEGLARGHQDGVQQGRASAIAEQKAAITALLAGWSGALDQFIQARERMLAEAQRDVIRLGLAIAEKVTRRAIAADPGVAAAQVAGVLELVLRPSRLSLRIAPADREIVEGALPALMRQFGAVKHVELVEDAGLERGSCVARLTEAGESGGAPAGEIDASISVQLDRIAEAILPGEGKP